MNKYIKISLMLFALVFCLNLTFAVITTSISPNKIITNTYVSTYPSNASIYVDGVYKGKTTDASVLVIKNLTSGIHKFRFIRGDIESAEMVYNLSEGFQIGYKFETAKSVLLVSNPPGAYVYVNGHPIRMSTSGIGSVTPVDSYKLDRGYYNFTFEKEGYYPLTVTRYVGLYEITRAETISVNLTSKYDTTRNNVSVSSGAKSANKNISLVSNPSSSYVYIKSNKTSTYKYLGQINNRAPYNLKIPQDNLDYSLKIIKTGYEPYIYNSIQNYDDDYLGATLKPVVKKYYKSSWKCNGMEMTLRKTNASAYLTREQWNATANDFCSKLCVGTTPSNCLVTSFSTY